MRKWDMRMVALAFVSALLLSSCASMSQQWATARSKDTIDAYEKFLARYPRSGESVGAENRLRELREARSWQVAKQYNTIDSYQEYLKQYPSGPFARDAERRLNDPSLEHAWFERANAANDLSAYRKFLSRYPRSALPVPPLLSAATRDQLSVGPRRNARARAEAMSLLAQIGDSRAIPALIDVLREPDLASDAALALAAFGAGAREAIPRLIEVFPTGKPVWSWNVPGSYRITSTERRRTPVPSAGKTAGMGDLALRFPEFKAFEVTRYYAGAYALYRISNRDLGTEKTAWTAWWEMNRKKEE